jgi:hydrogenase nickel incorporation protein HypA/HybF
MHELGLARNIAAIIKEHAKGRVIKEVRVAIGPLACIEKQALEFCWGLVTEKSEIENVSLGFMEAEGDTFVVRELEFMEEV